MKINQMKKDELFEGFISSNPLNYVRQGLEKIIWHLPFKMIRERLKENYGMLNLTM